MYLLCTKICSSSKVKICWDHWLHHILTEVENYKRMRRRRLLTVNSWWKMSLGKRERRKRKTCDQTTVWKRCETEKPASATVRCRRSDRSTGERRAANARSTNTHTHARHVEIDVIVGRTVYTGQSDIKNYHWRVVFWNHLEFYISIDLFCYLLRPVSNRLIRFFFNYSNFPENIVSSF